MEKCRYKSLEELPAIMCADDVKDVLGISISSTYELMKEKDFTSFKIGRRVVIYKSGVYIGIGNRQIPFEKNGMVLWVEYS